MEEKLFVYGTLKEKQLQKSLLKRAIAQTPDVLLRYRRSKIKIGRDAWVYVKNK